MMMLLLFGSYKTCMRDEAGLGSETLTSCNGGGLSDPLLHFLVSVLFNIQP